MSKLSAILRNEKILFAAIALLSIVAIVPYIAACFYIHPNADDWWFAHIIHEKGRIGFAQYFYQEWSGRYLANFLLALPKANMIETPYWYTLTPIIFISLTYVILYKFVRFFTSETNMFRTHSITLFSLAFYICSLPEMFSAIYWNCASYYLLANVFFLWFCYELMTYISSDRTITSLKFLKLLVLVFLCCGLTEIYIISMLVLFTVIVIYQWFKQKKLRYDFLVLILIAGIGCYLNIFSPGAQNRMDVSASDNSFIFSAVRAAYDLTILQLAPLFFSGFAILAILIYLSANRIKNRLTKLDQLLKINPLLTGLCIIGIFYLHHAASVYGAGYTLQGRVINISNLILYLSLIFLIFNLITYYSVNLPKVPINYILVFIILMAMAFNFSENSRIISKEVLVDLPILDKELKTRYNKILDAKDRGLSTVTIERVSVTPRSLSVGIYDSERNFYNSEKAMKEMSQFFGIEIKLAEK